MFCEKCGNNNSGDSSVCSYCGAQMPPKEKCNGFADILSYTHTQTTAVDDSYTQSINTNQTEGISEFEMKKIINKTDSIIKISQKNILIGLVSVVLGCIIIVCSICMISSNNRNKQEIKNLKNTINQYEEKLDLIIDELENAKEINDDSRKYDSDKNETKEKDDDISEKSEKTTKNKVNITQTIEKNTESSKNADSDIKTETAKNPDNNGVQDTQPEAKNQTDETTDSEQSKTKETPQTQNDAPGATQDSITKEQNKLNESNDPADN
ncbi:MAG: zinc ribbon domain-containing protein [Clostridia bacterium]|nr:zinc ribbon domain-containing protein [Clostridia bacterium]